MISLAKEISSYDGLNFIELQYRNLVEHTGEQIELYRGERGAREREAGRQGGREAGRQGGRKEGREGGREGGRVHVA